MEASGESREKDIYWRLGGYACVCCRAKSDNENKEWIFITNSAQQGRYTEMAGQGIRIAHGCASSCAVGSIHDMHMVAPHLAQPGQFMVSTNLRANSSGSRFHSFFISALSPLIVRIFFFAIFIFRICQTFSMGFQSGETVGQGSCLIPFSFFHVVATWDLCFESLSSCNNQSSPSGKKAAVEGRRPFPYSVHM
jgi:hypothetical protein